MTPPTPHTATPGLQDITISVPLNDRDKARLLKALAKENHMALTPVKAAPATPGWQTTEFWVTVLTAVGATAAAATNNLPPRYATLASTIAVVAYAISRGLAKH
jgi:hypothetical protein